MKLWECSSQRGIFLDYDFPFGAASVRVAKAEADDANLTLFWLGRDSEKRLMRTTGDDATWCLSLEGDRLEQIHSSSISLSRF